MGEGVLASQIELVTDPNGDGGEGGERGEEEEEEGERGGRAEKRQQVPTRDSHREMSFWEYRDGTTSELDRTETGLSCEVGNLIMELLGWHTKDFMMSLGEFLSGKLCRLVS